MVGVFDLALPFDDTLQSRPAAPYPADLAVSFLVTRCLKGGLADQELVAEDTQAPQVHLLVVGPALDHLRGQVVQCAAQSGSPGAAQRGTRVTSVHKL